MRLNLERHHVPGHALHENCLQRQIGVDTLVSSWERRALAVPLINRLPTANQSRVNRESDADFVPPSVYIGFRLLVLPKRRPSPEQCLRFARAQEGGLSPGRIDPTASRPAQPRTPSPPRRAALRPDRSVRCPGFRFDKSFMQSMSGNMYALLLRILYQTAVLSKPVESKTRTYYERFGLAQRTAGRRGAARPGRTRRRCVEWPISQPPV